MRDPPRSSGLGWTVVTGQAGEGEPVPRYMPMTFVERLSLTLSARIGMEQPDMDLIAVRTVVARVLELLGDSAEANRIHPLGDATVWLMAHALRNPELHSSLVDIKLNLPGLTVDLDDFVDEVVLLRVLREWNDRTKG